MGIYLPIAEMSVNLFVLLAMGAAVGFLSGMFGVGGGFLITPLHAVRLHTRQSSVSSPSEQRKSPRSSNGYTISTKRAA